MQDSVDAHDVLKSKLNTRTKELDDISRQIRESQSDVRSLDVRIAEKELEIRNMSSSTSTATTRREEERIKRHDANLEIRRLELDAESISKEKIVIKTKLLNTKKRVEKLQDEIVQDLEKQKHDLVEKIKKKTSEMERLREQAVMNRTKAANVKLECENCVSTWWCSLSL